MTKSEAAKICQSIKFMMDIEDYSEAVEEALNMAIETLEHEPTAEYSTDVISRQAAIDEMGYCQTFLFDTRDKDKKVSLEDVLYALEQLPSAQPFTEEQIQTMQELESAQVEKAYELGKADRPTGHWIKNEGMAPPEFTGRYVCSICGDYALMSMPYGSKQELSNFCPNCGADMRDGEEE